VSLADVGGDPKAESRSLIQKNASDRIIESGVCVASQAGLTADNHEALIVMQLGKKAPKA